MTTKIICDNFITEGSVKSGILYIKDGVISEFSDSVHDTDETHDLRGLYVSPGFIDIHTHGGAGNSFLSGDKDEIVRGCNFHFTHGTTSIAPTVSAAAFPVMRKAVENIAAARHSGELSGTILGAHLEGPYLSAKQCGAQCPDFITPPKKQEYESLVEDYGKDILRWTYAPENDTDGSFCRYIVSKGILASAGHTDAVYEDMVRAVENGCRLVTHLYSCTSTVTRKGGFRSLGVIESAFLRDELMCEIIADGKHLPPELILLILKIKGDNGVLPVTDSLELAGTSDTHGFMGATEYIIEDGVCKLCDRSAFAGSIATSDVLIRVLTAECGLSVERAVGMLTEQPSKLLGINKGKLCAGYDADIAVFDKNINVKRVYSAGKIGFEIK